MKITRDHVVGAVSMLLVLLVIIWGAWATLAVRNVMVAQNNLVTLMSNSGLLQQMQQAIAQRTQQVQQQPVPQQRAPMAAPQRPAPAIPETAVAPTK